MPGEHAHIAITGANGHLGRQLLTFLESHRAAGASWSNRVTALVRSKSAAQTLEALAPEIAIVDYADTESLASALQGCTAIVHLVGILKEGGGNRYPVAHERSCEALRDAALRVGARDVVYLSILGSSPDSANPCLASKGCAETILLDSALRATVLRVPMVIGRDDHTSRALRAQASARIAPLVGGGRTWQQPIDAADVVRAIDAALRSPASRILELAGREALTHRELVERAAALIGGHPTIVPIPVGWVRVFARLAERCSSNPPLTSAMLDVLQRDDRIDAEHAYTTLDIDPTPLDETLRRYVAGEEIRA